MRKKQKEIRKEKGKRKPKDRQTGTPRMNEELKQNICIAFPLMIKEVAFLIQPHNSRFTRQYKMAIQAAFNTQLPQDPGALPYFIRGKMVLNSDMSILPLVK
jgi:hypothetical protein